MSRAEVEQQAKLLARENRRAEPGITKVYWFPNESEVRLIELLPTIPASGSRAEPYYFRSDPGQNLPAPSGIAMIRPDEFRRVQLPPNWGTWDDAVELSENGER